MDTNTNYKEDAACISQEEINSEKLKAVEIIIKTNDEQLLTLIATYSPEENLSQVKETQTIYHVANGIEKLKLKIINEILTKDYGYLADYFSYIEKLTLQEIYLHSSTIGQAIKDIEDGRVYKASSVEDLFDQILKG